MTERRWEAVQAQLEAVRRRVDAARSRLGLPVAKAPKQAAGGRPLGVVVAADPAKPPHFLRVLLAALAESGKAVCASTHCHSSVGGRLDPALAGFLSVRDDGPRSAADVWLTLIWRRDSKAPLPRMSVGGAAAVSGEEGVARYLARLSGGYDEEMGPAACALADSGWTWYPRRPRGRRGRRRGWRRAWGRGGGRRRRRRGRCRWRTCCCGPWPSGGSSGRRDPTGRGG